MDVVDGKEALQFAEPKDPLQTDFNGATFSEWRPGKVVRLYRPQRRSLKEGLLILLLTGPFFILMFALMFSLPFYFCIWMFAWLFAPSVGLWVLWLLIAPSLAGIYLSSRSIWRDFKESFEREATFDWEHREARFRTNDRTRLVGFDRIRGITVIHRKRRHGGTKTSPGYMIFWCEVEINLRGLDELLFKSLGSNAEEAKRTAASLAKALSCPLQERTPLISF